MIHVLVPSAVVRQLARRPRPWNRWPGSDESVPRRLLILRSAPGGESALSPTELVENYRPLGSLTQYLMIY